MDLGIKGHVAIVTGAGRGIGAEIARALAAEGCRVAVWDRDAAPAREIAAAIGAAGGEAMPITASVADSADVQAAVQGVIAQWGGVQILVNNAGFSRDAPITQMSDALWHEVVDTCLHGVFYCARAVIPAMIAQRYGRLISISSRSSLGEVNKSNYAAAKAGVIGLTKALALELGEHDITVNAVAPGIVESERLRSLPHFEEIRARSLARMPVQRMGQPRDIAGAVLYLASAHAGFVTGDVLYVTGGRYG